MLSGCPDSDGDETHFSFEIAIDKLRLTLKLTFETAALINSHGWQTVSA